MTLPDRLTPEMVRAFCLHMMSGRTDFIDEMVDWPGTGNGDLHMVPRWVKLRTVLNLDAAYMAMCEAAEKTK